MNQFVNPTHVNQYEVNLLGSAQGDDRNTWKGVVETSLSMHASKFVRIGLTRMRKKGYLQRRVVQPKYLREKNVARIHHLQSLKRLEKVMINLSDCGTR